MLLQFLSNSYLLCHLQPFGEGLVTVTLPQLRRGENSLSLWNIMDINSPMASPVNTFVGHSDVVLEFQWRSQRLDGEPVYFQFHFLSDFWVSVPGVKRGWMIHTLDIWAQLFKAWLS